MSSIPNSAIPHAKPVEPVAPANRGAKLFGNLLGVAAAPALITLGLSVLTLSRLAKRLGGGRSSARARRPAASPPAASPPVTG